MSQHKEPINVSEEGVLFVVPTPIGNLEDITYRAVRVLGEVDVIACEDTRVTGRLLEHLKIERKRLFSLHARNEHARTDELLGMLRAGKTIALVSDAGTPGISDPGSAIIRAVTGAGVRVESLPGPNAAISALVASGLSTKAFVFEGFLPHKKGRQTRMKELAHYRETLVLYESPHRLLRTLRELSEHFGSERRAVLARELTKLFEEYNRGTLAELLADYTARPSIKGEFVLLIEGAEKGQGESPYAEGEPPDQNKNAGGKSRRPNR